MKVLMVDDEADIRKIGKLSLEAVGGHQVMLASSGTEGIECARADRPDVILMDMMMPGMDGLTTLAELRKIPDLEDVPVLFMTAKVQRQELDHYVRAGAIGVIKKPFDPMTLAADVRRVLEGRSKPGVP